MPQAITIIHISPSLIFTGRGQELEEFKADLGLGDQSRTNEEQQRFVLYGVGGSGETQSGFGFAEINRE